MFLAIHVSSLEIEFGVLNDEGKIVSKFSISTENKKTIDQYVLEIKNVFDYLKIGKDEITHAAILSTIPKFNHIIADFLKKYIKIEPIIITNNIVPLQHDNVDINEVPVDIFAGCYACGKNYGDNTVFINFDSIITFGVCINNNFNGYVVFPGMDTLADVLHRQDPNYPEIVIKETRDTYASTRYNALNCGVFNGIMGACDNIVNNILTENDKKQFKVVATCKNASLLKYSKTINIIDQDLRIKSIAEVSKYNLLAM